MQYGLEPFPRFQDSCGIIPNKPTAWVVSFSIRQGLNCLHVASTPALTLWLLCSNCTLHWTTMFLGLFSKTDTTILQQRSLLHSSPSTEFSGRMPKFLRSLAEYIATLAFLCCHYMFDSYITSLTLSLNTIYVSFHSHFFFFGALNSNYFGCIKIYFRPI